MPEKVPDFPSNVRPYPHTSAAREWDRRLGAGLPRICHTHPPPLTGHKPVIKRFIWLNLAYSVRSADLDACADPTWAHNSPVRDTLNPVGILSPWLVAHSVTSTISNPARRGSSKSTSDNHLPHLRRNRVHTISIVPHGLRRDSTDN